MEKYGRAGQATDDNIIRRMRFACCITKATDITLINTFCFFHGNNGYAKAPRSYVTLPVLFLLQVLIKYHEINLSC